MNFAAYIRVSTVGHNEAGQRAEIERWLTFRDRLRGNAGDRQLYERTKKELARRRWRDTNAYADAKREVIERVIAAARMTGRTTR